MLSSRHSLTHPIPNGISTNTSFPIDQWERASCIDRYLTINAKLLKKLAAKRIHATTFSHSKLFGSMLGCEPSLFFRFPIWINGVDAKLRPNETTILKEIRLGIPHTRRARVRSLQSFRYLPISKVVDKWSLEKTVFNVSDLNYMGTRFEKHVETPALNDFNLLSRGPYAYQSQDSLVISASGAFTDSHSDDHAGSNHCFVGEKLWLMWDTLEGIEHGLEDVERCFVSEFAKFDLKEFVDLKSSRWLIIGPGQTMFIPTTMTHKVITIERYLGLGSFHAAFPSFIDSLLHWAKLPPYWAKRSVIYQEYRVEDLVARAIRQLQNLKDADHRERNRWGIAYLKKRLARFLNSDESRSPWGVNKDVQSFVRSVSNSW